MRIVALLTVVGGLALCPPPVHAQAPTLPPPAAFPPGLVSERPAPQPGPFGYPVVEIDRDALLGLLRARRFDALEASLGGYREQVLADVRWEDHLVGAYASFFGSEKDIGIALEEWVNGSPGSAAARLARAEFFLARVWEARGQGFARDLERGQTRVVDTFLEKAIADAEQAVRLDPRNLAAHVVALRVLLPRGWSRRQEQVLQRALEIFPASYAIRSQAMGALEPRWGGSYERMQALAVDAQQYVPENPRLRVLLGAVLQEEGRTLHLDERYAEALEKFDQAERSGTDWSLYEARGRTWYYAGDYVRALAELDQAVAIRPHGARVLEMRGRSLARIAQRMAPADARVALLESAEADLVLAVRVNQPDADLTGWRDWASGRRSACEAAPTTCFDTRPVAATPPSAPTPSDADTWIGKIFLFVLGIPVTLYLILVESNQLGLGPAPLLAVALITWSFFEWKRQRFWTPSVVHVMAGLALLMILGINASWMSVGGGMWTQRIVVIVICPCVPYLVYLLALGPRYMRRRRKRQPQEEEAFR